MKILSVIGARPQIIKAAAVSNKLRKECEEILVHTGQHYDDNMSEIFFDQMNIPKPDYNLNIGSGNHGEQTGGMLIELEKLYSTVKPDVVLVYGDTNSTLAGALAASKLLIPVAHVEAGLRSFNKKMPEEQNRIVTDHLSSLLFAPTKTSAANLKNENITSGVYVVGDIMYDSAIYFSNLLDEVEIKTDLKVEKPYLLATIHRAENTNDPRRLRNIVESLNTVNLPVILPLHPRTRKYIEDYNLYLSNNIRILDPVGYLEMLYLEKHAKKILTDSGGVQKEAYFLKRPCITFRDETEWTETVENGWNVLVGCEKDKIIDAIFNFKPSDKPPKVFGNGDASDKIVKILTQNIEKAG